MSEVICRLIRDNFQNFKSCTIPKAQPVGLAGTAAVLRCPGSFTRRRQSGCLAV